MKPALLDKKLRYPRSWSVLPSGIERKAIVEAELDEITQQFFGYHLVKVGNLSSELSLSKCSIKHCVNMVAKEHENASMRSLSRDMALKENSVDGFVLAHELDFAQDPHQILREVDRAIMPDGDLVIVGFNPLSLTGLRKLVWFNSQSLLHEARFFSVPRIKDWLHLLGFEVTLVRYRPYTKLFTARPNNILIRWCQRFLPQLASVYIIVAKKRTVPLSPIKPKWQLKPKFSTVGASIRAGNLNSEKPQN
ncbi:methyltransferase domain-containing protein [Paraglaciecola sp. L1A13]|uniref:methyltransferase domain-containing protein n=1 Tax=Paraglaciecola sp. L1A13 TaxID=2686359 RepID=UPI00131AD6AD|nr:methyltransferase domain-containing protein [Paraglaciecola sp. L1A13]|tara:strand:- start:5894 stop:6643 length:750 start_codon:yes stop_codon:yes gene_type:complete